MSSSRLDLMEEIIHFEISIKENQEIMKANFYKTFNNHTASCFLWAIDNGYKGPYILLILSLPAFRIFF